MNVASPRGGPGDRQLLAEVGSCSMEAKPTHRPLSAMNAIIAAIFVNLAIPNDEIGVQDVED